MPTPLPETGGELRPTRVLLLAPDLDDAALWRRVAMLRAGGADLRILGFRRLTGPLPEPAEVLGTTRNGAMAQRALAVLRAVLPVMWRLRGVQTDAVLARNLEMLALARMACLVLSGRPRLVYEVLDIHRLMLGTGRLSRALRGVEAVLLARAGLILTSSPAFVQQYFRARARVATPALVVENRNFAAERWQPGPMTVPPPTDGPLVIGWFGILRCAASLAALDALTRAAPGRIRVVLRGRPARDVVPEFDRVVGANPDLDFQGAYRNPEDLARIYGGVHLVWAVDRYEAGGNSDWLLPNRLYEGCQHGGVPIALAGTETARFLQDRGIGVLVPDLTATTLLRVLGGLDGQSLADARHAVGACPPATWAADRQDARQLVAALLSFGGENPPPPAPSLRPERPRA